ncbi:hypothetical protein MY5147_006691 [Beauveria neobassiana]|uniref:Uncharacterized protein n=1 Tax=Beauveria bassiana D1-5 TaxID=1245745 RepID=A0A0A2VI05_BEABA|nr:hypothetical protein BBAD15_g7167 [Beauveria bassiana D1-5]
MDDIEPFEVPYQALWRIKHNGRDGLAFEWPGAPILLLLYCCVSATEFEPVQEVAVAKVPADCSPVGWFFHMDREEVKAVCTSIMPPKNAERTSDWISSVTVSLSERSMIFWEGDSEEDLIAFGALDPIVVPAIPTAKQESCPLKAPVTLDKAVSQPALVVVEKDIFSLALPKKPPDVVMSSRAAAAAAEPDKESCLFDPFISFDQVVAEPVDAGRKTEKHDEITYSSTPEGSQGSEDMEIEWF